MITEIVIISITYSSTKYNFYAFFTEIIDVGREIFSIELDFEIFELGIFLAGLLHIFTIEVDEKYLTDEGKVSHDFDFVDFPTFPDFLFGVGK